MFDFSNMYNVVIHTENAKVQSFARFPIQTPYFQILDLNGSAFLK